MGRLGKYLKPYWWYIAITMAIKFAATYFELMIPDYMEIILDEKVPTGDVRQIYGTGISMALCAILALCGNILGNRMTAYSSGRITGSVRHDLFKKLQNLSSRQMDELTVPSAESRLTSDTYNINRFLTRIQRLGVRAPIMLIGGIFMMLRMDAGLALVLICLLPVISAVVLIVRKYSVPLHEKQQTVLDDVVRVMQENITGVRVVKALSKEEYEKARFNGVNQELMNVGQKAGLITSITSPISSAILNVGLTLVVVIGAYRVNSGKIEPGVIVAFLQYFTMILTSTMQVTRIFIMWSTGQASANRVAEVLELPEDLQVQPAGEREENGPHIEFRDVSFSYTGGEHNLEHINFRLEHGQTLGILGATGSGKSTVLNLLLRLYDVSEGSVLIDGQDVRTIPQEELRKKFGVVFQNDFVTEGTIAHNIRFFRDVDEEGVEKAAEHAQAGFIAEKEGGMEAEVAVRGNNLSGGQKQRLLIARALAADPEILVLDDASSALDYQTDANLRRALREHYRNTTTVLVTQRISSLRHADLILVLSDGCVLGAGDHETLMEQCEEYRLIADAQMGDRKEGA